MYVYIYIYMNVHKIYDILNPCDKSTAVTWRFLALSWTVWARKSCLVQGKLPI